MFIAAAAALAVSLAAGSQASAPNGEPDAQSTSVSVERIREGLDRPPALKLPHPDELVIFRATVEERVPIDGVLEAMRRDLAAFRGSPISAPVSHPAAPVVGVDVIGLARSFLSWRAERNARRTVQEALDEFCSTHDCSVVESAAPIEGVSMPRVRPVP